MVVELTEFRCTVSWFRRAKVKVDSMDWVGFWWIDWLVD